MNAGELSLSITALANMIACQLDDDSTSLLAAVFSQLGDTLTTIVTQRSLCSKLENASKDANTSLTDDK